MSHIAFQPGGPAVELEADWVVVGSGAGGGAAAVQLARGGDRVAIVEAGPWRDPPDYPTSVYGAMRDMLEAWGATFTRGRAYWPIVQASLVGGTTVVNSAIAVRTPADVFDRWQRERGVGGPALAEAVWRIQDEIERELSVEEVPVAARGRSNLLAKQGADALGYENHVMRRYVKACLGRGQCLQGCKDDRKQSLNRNWIPEVLERGGEVLSCAPVDRVLFDGARAVGATGRFRHPQTRERGATLHVLKNTLAKIASNIAVKVPLTPAGLRVCKNLTSNGTMVNVTLCFSAAQAILAAKAGATFVSPFVGRLDDIGENGMQLIADICQIYSSYSDFHTEVLVASVRSPQHVVQAALMGAHVATIPPSVIRQLFAHPLTDKGLAQFVADWQKSGQRILPAKAA